MWPTSRLPLRSGIETSPLTSPTFGSGSFLFPPPGPRPGYNGPFFLRDVLVRSTSEMYVVGRHPHPLARFPFSAISPDKHRGRCPESRTAGARRLASRRPFSCPPQPPIWSSRLPTVRACCVRGNARETLSCVCERIPASRRLGSERRDAMRDIRTEERGINTGCSANKLARR